MPLSPRLLPCRYARPYQLRVQNWLARLAFASDTIILFLGCTFLIISYREDSHTSMGDDNLGYALIACYAGSLLAIVVAALFYRFFKSGAWREAEVRLIENYHKWCADAIKIDKPLHDLVACDLCKRCETGALGLRWERLAKAEGVRAPLLDHPRLASELRGERVEFTPAQWRALAVEGLTQKHMVMARDGRVYKPLSCQCAIRCAGHTKGGRCHVCRVTLCEGGSSPLPLPPALAPSLRLSARPLPARHLFSPRVCSLRREGLGREGGGLRSCRLDSSSPPAGPLLPAALQAAKVLVACGRGAVE